MQKNCDDCSLCSRRTQIVMPTPCLPGGLLAIGEAPGAEEDIAGEGFVGRAGKTLDKLLGIYGIARSDYGRANLCRCRPVDDAGKNRKPTAKEIEACLPKLAEFIGECRPGVILCVGWTPGQVFVPAGSLAAAIEAGVVRHGPGHSLALADGAALPGGTCTCGCDASYQPVSLQPECAERTEMGSCRGRPGGHRRRLASEPKLRKTYSPPGVMAFPAPGMSTFGGNGAVVDVLRGGVIESVRDTRIPRCLSCAIRPATMKVRDARGREQPRCDICAKRRKKVAKIR